MAEQDSAPGGDLDQIARIVNSYVRHHQLGPEQLVELIVTIHRALASLQATPPMLEPRRPAVPIQRSVQPDYYLDFGHLRRSRMGDRVWKATK